MRSGQEGREGGSSGATPRTKRNGVGGSAPKELKNWSILQATAGKSQMQIQEILDSRFQRVTPKSEEQGKAWERADAIIEVCKFLHYAEDAQLVAHLAPHEMISLMDYAKKHGDKPKAFFKYLVAERKKGQV